MECSLHPVAQSNQRAVCYGSKLRLRNKVSYGIDHRCLRVVTQGRKDCISRGAREFFSGASYTMHVSIVACLLECFLVYMHAYLRAACKRLLVSINLIRLMDLNYFSVKMLLCRDKSPKLGVLCSSGLCATRHSIRNSIYNLLHGLHGKRMVENSFV